MTFMPQGGECYDDAIERRLAKYGIGSPDFWATTLRLTALRVRYLADRAEAREIRPRKVT